MAILSRKSVIVSFLLGLLLGVAHASGAPKAVLPQTSLHFGKAVHGTGIAPEFVLKNDGTEVLRVYNVRMTAPLVVKQLPAQVAPGAQAVLRFALDTRGLQGPFEGHILVSLNDSVLPEARLIVTGEVVPTIEISPRPAFFVAAQRGQRKQASLDIMNHAPEPLRLEQVEHASDRFTTNLETLDEGRRYRLHLALLSDGPGGKKTETIVVKTSSYTTPLLRIPVNTYVRERVYTFPDTVDLGALPLTATKTDGQLLQRVAQTLMIYRKDEPSFQVTVRSDLPMLTLESVRSASGDRYQVTVALAADKLVPGPIQGNIEIATNDPEFPHLTVPVKGLIIAP